MTANWPRSPRELDGAAVGTLSSRARSRARWGRGAARPAARRGQSPPLSRRSAAGQYLPLVRPADAVRLHRVQRRDRLHRRAVRPGVPADGFATARPRRPRQRGVQRVSRPCSRRPTGCAPCRCFWPCARRREVMPWPAAQAVGADPRRRRGCWHWRGGISTPASSFSHRGSPLVIVLGGDAGSWQGRTGRLARGACPSGARGAALASRVVWRGRLARGIRVLAAGCSVLIEGAFRDAAEQTKRSNWHRALASACCAFWLGALTGRSGCAALANARCRSGGPGCLATPRCAGCSPRAIDWLRDGLTSINALPRREVIQCARPQGPWR